MKILIHACPQRMWYVAEFEIPALIASGVDPGEIRVWLDNGKRGNLRACMDAFAACEGDGGTWHLQDDVLPCRDFAARARALDEGLVYGFCCRQFTDDPLTSGLVYMEDAWHSFQCVRIPDAWARECAAGLEEESPRDSSLRMIAATGKHDDYLFREFLLARYPDRMVRNVKPCLVEHVDVLIGGSTLGEWRGYWARAEWFPDKALVDALHAQLRARSRANN